MLFLQRSYENLQTADITRSKLLFSNFVLYMINWMCQLYSVIDSQYCTKRFGVLVYGFWNAIILEGWIRQEQISFFVSARIQISTRNPLCSNIERVEEEMATAFRRYGHY